jgi:carbon monoxide dehydrogenase subunit G
VATRRTPSMTPSLLKQLRILVGPALAILAWTLSASATAATIGELAISRQGESYQISFEAEVDAPPEEVFKMLSDYAQLGRLSPVITSVEVEPAPGGRAARVRSVLTSCFLFFCRRVVMVEDVTEPDRSTIVAQMVPGMGDFSSGRCVWHISGDGAHTKLRYEATRTTALWIPPLIGQWVMARTMREHLETSVGRLETLIGHPAQP